ncbi:ATP-binding cassette domain-containing protein [Amycolatopsis sp.]|uniref:ATP-binding cassette domain-containing protein n=1 Tax=Amycolatopsis sp. TaxID=37632 RepID=UPI002E02846A|nr:ATP-binding cassette domain-containing protein [Amycolatopsis sp.]
MTRPHGDAIVVTEGLRKRFGTKEALTGLDLSVPTGTIFGLLGPNGAGKSTAVRVLSTLTRPTSGRATVAGYDVATEAGEVRKRIGLAGQHPAVDDKLTGRENLRMFGRLARLGERGARARADELLAKFGLEHAADRLTETYSGGMRRRIDLITSLITAPAVLFLDEPTIGLDPRSRNEIWATVRDLVADGTTVLLTTQYLDEADQLAANIAVVDGGKVIASGTPDELKARIGSHLDVIVSDPAHLEGAATVLSLLGNSVAATDLDELSVSVPLRAEVQLPVVVRELDAAGVVVRDVGLRKPTLDDVFLTLTGKEVAA